jgi:hypothetical protein
MAVVEVKLPGGAIATKAGHTATTRVTPSEEYVSLCSTRGGVDKKCPNY